MKSVSRRVAILVLAVAVSVAPLASAAPRDDRDDIGSKIIRVVKKFQRFILVSLDDLPVPPKP